MIITSTLTSLKNQISEKYCAVFLCVVLLAMVTIDNEKLVINIYRALVCLPILVMIRPRDFLRFVKQPFVNRYFLLTVFCLLSLFWSDSDHIKNVILKILAMTVFLYLIYLVSVYQSFVFSKLDSIYLCMILVLLSLYTLSHMGDAIPIESVFGVFENKNELAWALSAGCLVAGYKLTHEKVDVYLLGVFLILSSFIWVLASRAALLTVFFGMLLAFYFSDNRRIKVFGMIMVVVVAIGLIIFDSVSHLIQRADAYRFDIYINAYYKITESITSSFFGNGIASDSESIIVSTGVVIGHWHSIYISMLYYDGLIGLMLMCYCFFYRYWLLYKKEVTPCVWDVVLFGVAIALLFDGNSIYSYPNGVFMSFVIPAFFANMQRVGKRRED